MSFVRFLLTKTFLKQLGIALLVTVALVFLLLFYLRVSTNHDQRIQVPDLAKMTLDEANSALSELELRWEILDTTNYNPEYPKQSIIEQLPKAGSMVKENRTIYLTVNRSDYRSLPIPNVVGRTRRQAEPTLISMGFKIGKVTYRPYIAKDEVLQLRHNGELIEPGVLVQKTAVIDLVLGDGKGNLRMGGSSSSSNSDSDG
ncbi:PASTA domain-containing protein [Gilvibacter sp.]|uniref:PASTA domain-containing protein n=1 Tax=Gilvibacter sp. TaxID=2729997 RepID=UPI0025C21744|nr:PASTA domain-containing protein [Gilvibacter sp.]NQX76589.1 PASTA domain-containing protein [Gilvibacter sp.]